KLRRLFPAVSRSKGREHEHRHWNKTNNRKDHLCCLCGSDSQLTAMRVYRHPQALPAAASDTLEISAPTIAPGSRPVLAARPTNIFPAVCGRIPDATPLRHFVNICL